MLNPILSAVSDDVPDESSIHRLPAHHAFGLIYTLQYLLRDGECASLAADHTGNLVAIPKCGEQYVLNSNSSDQ